jgi:hypothetical protein
MNRVGLAIAGFIVSRRKVRAGQGTVVANGHPGRPAGKCHRKYTADVPMGTGNGEMVRQGRTAAPVTAPAGQTPPPARPSSWLLGPSISGLGPLKPTGRSLAERQS